MQAQQVPEISNDEYLAAVERGAQQAFAKAARIAELKALPLLSVQQAAELYGVGVGTLNKRRMEGLPPAYVKLGGSVRYTHEDMQQLVKHGRQKVMG